MFIRVLAIFGGFGGLTGFYADRGDSEWWGFGLEGAAEEGKLVVTPAASLRPSAEG